MTAGSSTHDPRRIFTNAVQFENAGVSVYSTVLQCVAKATGHDPLAGIKVYLGADNTLPIFPLTVLNAFAIELYLKCLLAIEGGQERTHDLFKLFSKLSGSTQDLIRAEHVAIMDRKQAELADRVAAGEKYDVDSILQEASKAFEEFRYHFEGAANNKSFKAVGVIWALRRTIVKLKPEFGPLVQLVQVVKPVV